MDPQSGPSSVGHKMTGSLPALEQTFSVFMRHRYVFIESLLVSNQMLLVFTTHTHIHACLLSLIDGCDAASYALCAVLSSRVQCL